MGINEKSPQSLCFGDLQEHCKKRLIEVNSFKVTTKLDFIVMGSRPVFANLSTNDIVKDVWGSINQEEISNNHDQCTIAINSIISKALTQQPDSSITSVLISFRSLCKQDLLANIKEDSKDQIVNDSKNSETHGRNCSPKKTYNSIFQQNTQNQAIIA